jgi:succinate dehydrogenase/fumarate reductase flavoprotein subunit
METLEHHAGPKYFTRSGQATWVGVVRDPHDQPVGPFLTNPDRHYSDMIIEVDKTLFQEYARTGRGPVYMDCRGISEEDHAYMQHWFEHEGFGAFTRHLHEKGLDLRKNPIEWATYGMRGSCGCIVQDERGRTSVEGLYVAGDETTRSISPAAIFGWIAGQEAAQWSQSVEIAPSKKAAAVLEETKSFLKSIQIRQVGPDWREVNIALQQIMSDYAGGIRSQALLQAGLNHLRRLRDESRATVIGGNPHQIMRTMEVFNLMDLSELVFLAALERRETRGNHRRTDYPYLNPLLEKQLVVKKVDDRPTTIWR